MSEQKIDIHVQSGTGEVLRIAATLLLFGGAGAIAWAVAQGPNAEMAATGFSMMLVMMLRLAYGAGRIGVPARQADGPDDFAATKSALSQIAGEYRAALAKANMPVMVLISIAYAIGFLVLRAGVAAALGIFSNLYIAGGAAAMVGAIVVFPSLLPSILSSLKRKGVVTDAPAAQPSAPAPIAVQQIEPAPAPAPVQQVTPAPAVPAPAPVQQVTPAPAVPAPAPVQQVTPAPAVPAPAPVQQVTPAPAVPAPEPVQQIEQQTAAPKKIVRRVKKEQSDV